MSKPPEPSSYDPQISEIYRDMSQEQPDAKLDSQILAHAEKKIAGVKTKPVHVATSPWRKYQWPFSVAASAVFLTFVVYTQFDQFDPGISHPNSLPADPLQIADQATFDAQQAQAREKLEKKALTLGKPMPLQESALPEQEEVLAELTVEEPDLSNYAEQEAQTLAARALDDVEIDPLVIVADAAIELDTTLPLQGIDAEVAQQYAARQAQSQSLEEAAERRLASEQLETEMIRVTGARVDNSLSLNTEYLDNLLAQYQTIEQEKATGDTASLQSQRSSQQEIQRDIVGYLTLLKAAQPDIEIDQKYLQILTAQQRQELSVDD